MTEYYKVIAPKIVGKTPRFLRVGDIVRDVDLRGWDVDPTKLLGTVLEPFSAPAAGEPEFYPQEPTPAAPAPEPVQEPVHPSTDPHPVEQP